VLITIWHRASKPVQSAFCGNLSAVPINAPHKSIGPKRSPHHNNARIISERQTMTGQKQRNALALLAKIQTGSIADQAFTTDARWWWNGGLDFAIAEFDTLLGQLHTQTVAGIDVEPGLIMAQGDSVMIEATSASLLKNGKRYANRYLFLIHFDGDRIREVREYSDTAHVLATFDMG
jgi:ketosteroid isomerase-like protein